MKKLKNKQKQVKKAKQTAIKRQKHARHRKGVMMNERNKATKIKKIVRNMSLSEAK